MIPAIRHAEASEADALADLWLAFTREHNGRYVRHIRQTRANRDAVAAHFTRLAAQKQLWVLDAAGAPAGYAAVSPNLPRVDTYFTSAALTDLYVVPALRGAGWGKALIARVRAEVAERGLDALTITVTAGNPARAMYRAAGFRAFTETLVMPLVPGTVKTGPDYREA